MSDTLHKMDDRTTLRLTASLRAECRLLLVCDQLLDADIQPIAEDFVVTAGDERYAVVAVDLASPMPPDSDCSALLLQMATPLPKSDRLRVTYRPTQWLMWSAVLDKSVAPFEHVVPADDKSLTDCLQQWPELDVTVTPSDYAPVFKTDSTADEEKAALRVPPGPSSPAANEISAAALAALRAPQPADNKTLLDRLVAILILCALVAGGVVVVLLLYIGIRFFGGDFFEQPEAAKPRVVGVCNLAFPNGDRYQGQCVDGVGDGQGVYYYKSGDRYVGGWYGQNRHGAGIVTTSDGKVMEGHWRNGVAYGSFTVKWPNGTQYVGEIENDIPHGEGAMTFANGDSYTGQFVKNLKHGQGLMKWASGISYEGRYENDVPNGFGIYKMADGSRFEGMFVDGQVTQNGTCYLFDGTSSRGPCAQ